MTVPGDIWLRKEKALSPSIAGLDVPLISPRVALRMGKSRSGSHRKEIGQCYLR